MLYFLVTKEAPYKDLMDHEVVNLYTAGSFPDVSKWPIGTVMEKCWRGEYSNATQLLNDIRQFFYTPSLQLKRPSLTYFSVGRLKPGVLSNFIFSDCVGFIFRIFGYLGLHQWPTVFGRRFLTFFPFTKIGRNS